MIRAQAAVCAVATACSLLASPASGKESAQFRRIVAAARAPLDQRAPRAALADKDRSHAKGAGDRVARQTTSPHSRKDAPSKGAHATKKPLKLRPIRQDPPNAPWRAYRREPWRRGYVSLFGHGKRWSGYLVGPSGEVPPLARKALSATLASWRTGKSMLMDERLIGLIADVSDEFGGRPIRIVSGYREQSYAPDSKHKVGQAFDFSIPGVPNEILKDYLRSLPDVGVGFYPNSTHVHLDVRDKPTYWVDYSRPGEHPMYSYERRVAGLTPAERALAAALDAIGLPGASKTQGPDAKLASVAPGAPGDRRARVAEPALSSVAVMPAAGNGARSVAAPTDDDADDESEPSGSGEDAPPPAPVERPGARLTR